MPRCPGCGKEIDWLLCEAEAVRVYKYTLKYKWEWIHDDETGEEKYCCPECYEEIAEDEDGAIEFLKGK